MRPRAIAAARVSRRHFQVGEGRPGQGDGHAGGGTGPPAAQSAPQGHGSRAGGGRPRTAASLRAISAARLNVSQRSHLRPINVVVCDGPLRRPQLGAGFALRCLQRLSPPDAATRLRAGRHDRHTVGPSDPVLSY